MKSLREFINEAMENIEVKDLKVTYLEESNTSHEVYINCPETFQEDDIHQYIDDMLLNSMPSDPDIGNKFFGANYSKINDAYFEYDSFTRLSYKKDDVNVDYDSEYGKNVDSDIKIVTYVLHNLKYNIMFASFTLMKEEDESLSGTIEKIFSAYENNAYNDYKLNFKFNTVDFKE